VIAPSSSGETPKPRKRVVSPEIGEKGGPPPATKKPRAAIQFGVPSAKPAAPVEVAPAAAVPALPANVEKPAQPKERIDPQLVAKARELRDRYLEQVNERPLLASSGKYDVARVLPSAVTPSLPHPVTSAPLSPPPERASDPAYH
jgi:hypothetical protein